MKKYDNNKKVIIISLILIGLFIISTAISYAYFVAKIIGNESTSTISATAAYLELTFTDGNSTISGTNIAPGWSASKEFTVENTGNKTSYYKLKITDINNPLIIGGLSFSITSNDGGGNVSKRIIPLTSSVVSESIEIPINTTHHYTITAYYDNLELDQSRDVEKNFSYTVTIEVSLPKSEPQGWSTAEDGTLLAAIKTNYPESVAPITIPGQFASLGTIENSSEFNFAIASDYKDYYYTYSEEIEDDPQAPGKFKLVNPQKCQFSDSNCRNTLKGKYIVGTSYSDASNESDTLKTSTGLSNIYQITNNITYNASDNSYIYYKMATSLAANEKTLSSTTDDYGTSYYFRGNVDNNYVQFAGKCWRIVRIDGNGNIKLFYWGNVVNNQCTNNSNAYSNIKYNDKEWTDLPDNPVADGFTPPRTKVYTSNRPAGVGFMYGNVIGTKYQDLDANKPNGAQDNIYDSDILDKLKDFYDDFIINNASGNLENYLADVIWCGDKSIASNSTGTGVEFDKETRFGAYKRLLDDKKPTLICPDAGNDGKLSKYTAEDTTNGNGLLKGENGGKDGVTTPSYKIGLITADEVAFAGGVYGVTNSSYYLYTGGHYWTMSPSNFNVSTHLSIVWHVHSTGALYGNGVTNGRGVRPAVSLKRAATISGGNGTMTNPFIINGVGE